MMNDNNILIYTDITNLDININYNYIKLLLINSCKYFTNPDKLFNLNKKYDNIIKKSNLYDLLKSNNIYKYINNTIYNV